jgi:hypothetical protein
MMYRRSRNRDEMNQVVAVRTGVEEAAVVLGASAVITGNRVVAINSGVVVVTAASRAGTIVGAAAATLGALGGQ